MLKHGDFLPEIATVTHDEIAVCMHSTLLLMPVVRLVAGDSLPCSWCRQKGFSEQSEKRNYNYCGETHGAV